MDDSGTNEEVLLRFEAPDGRRAIVLEDDGKVAYAYLLENDEMIGDVWLYNVAETPDTVDWKDPSAMPFLNPKPYVRQEPVSRVRTSSKVVCRWSDLGVDVTIDGTPMARLERGAKPGWSRLALRPGPLAQPLERAVG